MTINQSLLLPDLGDNADSGVIVRVVVNNGDKITAGDTVVEVETDKVILDIPATADGVVEAVLVAEGDTVAVGAPLATVVSSGDRGNDASQILPRSREDESPPRSDRTTSAVANAGNDTATTATLHKQQSPAIVRTPSDAAPLVLPPAVSSQSMKVPSKLVPAGPSARRMAREIGVDISDVTGSGAKGRISVDDIKVFAREKMLRQTAIGARPTPLPDLAVFGATRSEALTGIEQATADNMQRAWREIPHAWLNAVLDITSLERHRQQHKAGVAESGGGLSLTVFVVKALALLVREQPRFNAAFDPDNAQILYRDYVDIGVAVDTPRGLVVPVLRGVDAMNLQQVAIGLSALVARAKDGKLSPKDLQGGGITLSNLGGFNVCGLQPIINWPQSAIVGVGAAASADGQLMLPVTLGFDHRIINGADGGRFLQGLRALLEDPFLFSLKG